MNLKRLFTYCYLILPMILLGQKNVKKQCWTAYSQSVPITADMLGADFKVSIYIRKEESNSNGKAALWTRVDKGGFFHNNLYDENVEITENWNKYEIEGNINESSTNLYFGIYAQNNGIFYFDMLEAFYKNKINQWIPISVNNPSFEKNSTNDNWNEGIRNNNLIEVTDFNISYSNISSLEGKYALKIEGKNIIGGNENGKYVKINNANLYYETYGKGDPLLLIHGNGQSIGAFINQVEEFSKNYFVIVVDCRGRGNSSIDKSKELTYNLQAEDMMLLLDHLEIENANIVGWSDGGIIGLIMALKYPEKIKKLVAFAANIFPEGLKDERLESHKKTLSSMQKEGKSGLTVDLYNLLVNYPKLKYEDLNDIKADTLIMAGDHDVIKNIHTVKIFENIPNAQLAISPNETHWMPEDNPELFNTTVMNFLEAKK